MSRKSKISATIENQAPISHAQPTAFTHRPLGNGQIKSKMSPDEIQEHISESNVCFKNYRYPGAEEAFPYQPELHTVDRYYPLAKMGPVYMDEPQFDEEIKICEKKAEVIRGKGHKYVILSKDCDLLSAMEQLGVA